MAYIKKWRRISGKMMLVGAIDTDTGQAVDARSLPWKERQYHDDSNVQASLKTRSGTIERKEVINMTEQKAVPLNVVVSDKGQKAKRIGKAFVNLDGKVPLSLTISLKALRAALESKIVTETDYRANEQYPDDVLDGQKVLRMAGFTMRRKSI